MIEHGVRIRKRSDRQAAEAGAPQPDDEQQKAERRIGERIAQLRSEMGQTLEQLAAAAGFTKGYLSKIENGKKVPPIGSLARIARALGTDMAYFLQSEVDSLKEGISIVHRSERQPAIRGGTAFGYDYETLAHKKRNKKMEPFIFSFPSKIDKHIFFHHEGEEFFFILSGSVEFEAGGEKWILEAGDSVYLDSRIPHKGRSLDGEAKAVVVIYSPESEAV